MKILKHGLNSSLSLCDSKHRRYYESMSIRRNCNASPEDLSSMSANNQTTEEHVYYLNNAPFMRTIRGCGSSRKLLPQLNDHVGCASARPRKRKWDPYRRANAPGAARAFLRRFIPATNRSAPVYLSSRFNSQQCEIDWRRTRAAILVITLPRTYRKYKRESEMKSRNSSQRKNLPRA